MFEDFKIAVQHLNEQITNPKAYEKRIKDELDKACEEALTKKRKIICKF